MLRNRLVLLHHFSDLFCPSIPMFDLETTMVDRTTMISTMGLDDLRGVMVSSAKVSDDDDARVMVMGGGADVMMMMKMDWWWWWWLMMFDDSVTINDDWWPHEQDIGWLLWVIWRKLTTVWQSSTASTLCLNILLYLCTYWLWVYSILFQEAAFRKVVQATMIRDRQHGPVIEINRIQVKRSRSKGGLAGPDGIKSVFGQVCSKMATFGPDSLMLPHRVWKVKFIGKWGKWGIENLFIHDRISIHISCWYSFVLIRQ